MTSAATSPPPTTYRFTNRADLEILVPVQASVTDAFAAITDWPAQGEWMLGTRVWVSRGSGHSVGDELSGFTGIGRLGFLDTMDVTRFDDNLVVVQHTGKVVRGIGWMGARPGPSGHGAVLVWGESVDLPLGAVGRAGWSLLVKPLLSLAVRQSLRSLARNVRQRVQVGAD